MAIVGLKMVRLALVDPKTQKLLKGADGLSTDGVIEVDSAMLGTRTANISNLEGQATKIPGNNSVQDVMIAPGSPTVAFDFNNPTEIKQKMLGFKPTQVHGWMARNLAAVLIESETLDRNTQYSLVSLTVSCKNQLKTLLRILILLKLAKTTT
ncbi:MAG: phage tail protein [Streptococcus salivarius]